MALSGSRLGILGISALVVLSCIGVTTLSCRRDPDPAPAEGTNTVPDEDVDVPAPAESPNGGDLSTADVTVDDDSVYSGAAQQPGVSVSLGGKRLSFGRDYSVAYSDNVEPGTAYATVKGIGDYTGSKRVPFGIAKFDIRDADVEIGVQAYTGSEVKPILRVTANGTVLRPYDEATGTGDYRCSYADNVDIGDNATVTITGCGSHCTGQATRRFSIERMSVPETSLEYATISYDQQTSDMIYDGTPKEPRIHVKMIIGGRTYTLIEDIDYTVRYSDNVGPGPATATVTAVNGSAFTGTKSVSFVIVKPDANEEIPDAYDVPYKESPVVLDESGTGK